VVIDGKDCVKVASTATTPRFSRMARPTSAWLTRPRPWSPWF